MILYDRSQLLECLAGLREGLQCIKHARQSEHYQQNTPPQRVRDVTLPKTLPRLLLKLQTWVGPG